MTEHSPELTAETTLARYINHETAEEDSIQADWMKTFQLTPAESALLQANGHRLEDVRAWAAISSTPDPTHAAKALADHVSANGPQSVPLFAMMQLLERDHLGIRALHVMLRHAWPILTCWQWYDYSERSKHDAMFAVFLHLLRHVRAVWPRALESVAANLLNNVTNATASGKSLRQLRALTSMLNKSMLLLAVPTVVEPIKNNIYQERAIIRVLRFMVEHYPPLQLNREGYRAVILVQLAQRKSPNEQQWAEVKALSWPPWKEERTAMDADITLENHGVSKAHETLKQMRDAGYGPEEWERVAAIYTGWDTDRTPTVQTLVLLGSGGTRFRSGAAAWAARITTTRTVQEAWACYLAFEDENLPPDQEVYLAIFRKLHKEEARQARESKPTKGRDEHGDFYRPRLYPGDSQEVEPLPPSTHLYTYTRTPPPTLEAFYGQLRTQGIDLEEHCMAYLIAKADTLGKGIAHLVTAAERQPAILGLLSLDPQVDLSLIPMPIFAAFIELLSRFSRVPLSTAMPGNLQDTTQDSHFSTEILDKQKLNINHSLVRSIELLKRRRPLFRPAWNSVLRAFGHESSLQNLWTAITSTRQVRPTPANHHTQPMTTEQERWRAAITAYRLVRRVLSLMRETHLDLDIAGFHALCLAVENVTIACWMLLRDEVKQAERGLREPQWIKQAVALLRSSNHTERLKGEFRTLVGDQDTDPSIHGLAEAEVEEGLRLPRLFWVPSPVLLHAHIRALGWMADYQGLLDTVAWMVEYRHELEERRERDRNGEIVMRRALVALRVFLERSWLSGNETRLKDNETRLKDHEGVAEPARGGAQKSHSRMERQLSKLDAPGSTEIVEEVAKLVDSVEDWHGWPTDQEVRRYCEDYRFQQFLR